MRIIKDLLQELFHPTAVERVEYRMKAYLRELGWIQCTSGTQNTYWSRGMGANPIYTLDHAFAMEREWQRRKSKPETPLGARNCRHGTPYTSPCEKCDVEYARSEERV